MTSDSSPLDSPAEASSPSHGWRRALLLYVGLVGLPSLGVAGIIRVGERVTPPMAVGGRWIVTFAEGTSPASGCFATESVAETSPFTLVQSGTHVTVTIGEPASTSGDGRLHGERLEVTLPAPRGANACESKTPTTLAATIGRDESRQSMAGELVRPGCSVCPPLAFRAEHSAESKR